MNKFLSHIEKKAAFGQLASMVAGKAKSFSTAMKSGASKAPSQVKQLFTGKAPKGTTMPVPQGYNFRRAAASQLARNSAVQGVAGAAAGGAALGSMFSSKKEKHTKVAKLMSEENKQVAKTFLASAAADLPASAAGAWAGNKLGSKFNRRGLGIFLGGHIGGGLGTLAAMKTSLHGKVKEK